MKPLRQFIEEDENKKPYQLIVFNNSADNVRDVGKEGRPDFKLLKDSARKVGIKIFDVEWTGLYLTEKNNKIFLNSLEFDENGYAVTPEEDGTKKYQNPIEINPENTLLFTRGLGTMGYTSNRRWVDIVSILEKKGFVAVPSVKTWDICSSKYFTGELFKINNLRIPKQEVISYSDDGKRAVKELGLKYPVILKSSSGSQTGVGVVVAESERSLHSFVQMISLLNPKIDLMVQELVEKEFDVRAIICNGKILGAMKRMEMKGDVRSNASLGADTEFLELTELEKQKCMIASDLVGGKLTGVDFIPGKDREKDEPIFIEINSMPGFGAIDKIVEGESVTEKILNDFKNREYWT